MRGESRESESATAFASNRARTVHFADRGYQLQNRELIHAVRTRRWKLIVYPGMESPYVELHDLESDAAESRNVVDQFPEIVDGLQRILTDWRVEERADETERELSEEDREQLMALGYLGS